MKVINIANDFSVIPGGRYIREGDYSGEDFRDKILKPAYIEAKKVGEKLKVNLDGTYGYPTSFLEEAFGGLAREFENENILNIIEIECEDEPGLIDDIKIYARKDK